MRISSPWVLKFWVPVAVVALFFCFFAWEDWGYKFFDSGQTVTPSARVHLVFAEHEGASDSYRCSASTADGEQFSLPRYDRPRPQRSTGGKTPSTYWAVADLPIDKGPLTVSCPGDPRLWLAMPHPPIYFDFMTNGAVQLLTYVSLFLVFVISGYSIKVVRRLRGRKKGDPSSEYL